MLREEGFSVRVTASFMGCEITAGYYRYAKYPKRYGGRLVKEIENETVYGTGALELCTHRHDQSLECVLRNACLRLHVSFHDSCFFVIRCHSGTDLVGMWKFFFHV